MVEPGPELIKLIREQRDRLGQLEVSVIVQEELYKKLDWWLGLAKAAQERTRELEQAL